ncbi:MAG TPA: 6-phosphogluconolactonase [Methyloceanibacter sp.]|nr:6-phosphogluconolactonase [Methyloceanibacter sp.]
MIEAEWHDYDSGAEMAAAVAEHVGRVIDHALDTRGEALVALPGGKSPIPVFECLAAAKIDWSRVTIIPTDDRLVPDTDPLSNFAMIARHFLPKGAQVLPIVVEGAADYRTAGNSADAQLAGLKWPPDLVWLGVGPDGHTASIFPGPDLEEALDGPKTRRIVGLMPDPLPAEAPVARVTLSRAAILSARAILLAFSGADKRAVVERAIKDGALSSTPIGLVLAETENPIAIHWSAT